MKLNKFNTIVKDHKGMLGGAGVGAVGGGLIGNLGMATLGAAIGLPSTWILVPFGLLVGSMADK